MTLQTYPLSEKMGCIHTMITLKPKKLAPILQANVSLIFHLQLLVTSSMSKSWRKPWRTGLSKCSPEPRGARYLWGPGNKATSGYHQGREEG